MYIDTHCHLSCLDYDDIDTVIKDNRKNEIEAIIISGCTLESIKESLELSKKYADVFVSIGFHPSEVNSITQNDLDYLESCLKFDKVVGIGEIGLDYHYEPYDKNLQMELFRKQLKLAEKYKLPVVIHSRDATMDTIHVLKEFPNVKGVIHCFSGSLETAKIYISMGYLLGIGGVVTFSNSNLYKVIENIGLDSIVLETDSPYLAPVPYRGQKNSSKYIPIIAEKISDILNLDVKIVSKKTLDNTYRMFDLYGNL